MRQPRLQFYTDTAGESRWRLVGANGEVIVPPEGYTNASDCRKMAERVLRGDFRVAIELAERLPDVRPVGDPGVGDPGVGDLPISVAMPNAGVVINSAGNTRVQPPEPELANPDASEFFE